MNCNVIQDLIRDGVVAGLSAAERQALDAHVADCAACREIVLPEYEVPTVEAPPRLLEAILAQTSGPACRRAETLLCEELDAELSGLDAELVRSHADGCADCAVTRTVLGRISEDLVGMREMNPYPQFVDDVLAATSGSARRPSRQGPARALWNRLVQRPRFAWEAAYVGAMLFWLVLGGSISDGPDRFHRILPEIQSSSDSLETLRGRVSGLGHSLWSSADAVWTSSVDRLESGLDHHSESAQKTLTGVRRMTRQAGVVVKQLVSRPEDAAPTNPVNDDHNKQE